MPKGRIYLNNNNHEPIDMVYHLHDTSTTGWWGDFTTETKEKLQDNSTYWIQFADNAVGTCSVIKQVNKSMSGILPLYSYRFKGQGPVIR